MAVSSFSSSTWVGMWVTSELALMGTLVWAKADLGFMVRYWLLEVLAGSVFGLGVITKGHLSLYWWSDFFLIMGLMVKYGLFPFHHWLPGLLAGKSWEVVWLLLGPAKIFVFPGFMYLHSVMVITALVALFGLVFGGWLAGPQRWTSSMLAYSSVGHQGVIAMLASQFPELAFVYLFSYIVILFPVAYRLCDFCPEMEDLKSFGCVSLLDRWILICCVGSLGGLAPFMGFALKYMAMSSLMELGGGGLLLYMLGLLPTSYYVLQVMSYLAMEDEGEWWMEYPSSKGFSYLLFYLSAMISVFGGVATVFSILWLS